MTRRERGREGGREGGREEVRERLTDSLIFICKKGEDGGKKIR